MSTEAELRDWRYGSTQAERLCASLLHSEGFDAVDPQNPLGGPDGRKDVLCEKGGKRYVAACYFPTTHQDFKEIKEKLLHDNEGVSSNHADGLIFFTNQKISPTERATLTDSVAPNHLEIYHLERIRAILDSPKGYGIRMEFLRIPMTSEEQLRLHSVINFRIDERLKEQNRSLLEIKHALKYIRMRTDDIAANLTAQPSSLDSTESQTRLRFPTSAITLNELLWIHRLVTDNGQQPLAVRGALRNTEVWIGVPGKGREEAEYIPPPPDEVPVLIDHLLSDWRQQYTYLVGADRNEIIASLAKFHHDLLAIHPFLDGNGRLARAILQQQSLELLDKWVSARFTDDPESYYETLRQADNGNINPLVRLISSSLE